jgi:hypothetical protein
LIKIKQFQNRNLIAHDATFVLKTTKTAANISGVGTNGKGNGGKRAVASGAGTMRRGVKVVSYEDQLIVSCKEE